MPVGNGAAPELLPTPEQRKDMDFQNDGAFVGGCIAGGRRYLHINAKGLWSESHPA